MKGEKGFPCVFWNWIEREDAKTGGSKKIPFLKQYTVFNVAQCTKIDYPIPKSHQRENVPISECEKIVLDMETPPEIIHSKTRALYRPSSDRIEMPSLASFDSPEFFYSTLYHELIHSTGHGTRLNRSGVSKITEFGSHAYSKEELIAEMGATFLCGHVGIENAIVDNSASYIACWLKRLKADNKFVVQSASQGQRAADYVLRKTMTT